ncbi:hypothetical protein HYV11_02920 [Candidatus Dependentiae bacterium]|nr:hypothetical protein [Candidatus Dependentiae bacterium]
MIINNKFFLQLFFIVVFWGHCLNSDTPIINVWVHGTYPALNLLTSKKLPFRSWVYVKNGISLAKELPENYYFHQLAKSCHSFDSEQFNIDTFYTYGWYSSKMRPGHRKVEGEKLFQSLSLLLEEYKKQHETIILRLIGFSHGGNVVLHAVSHLPFAIDGVTVNVVLLATPIQESSCYFVNNSCIHRVYSFYSDADWIQRIDAQIFHHDAPHGCPVWSCRRFKNTEEVLQVRLKIDDKFIGHSTYRSYVKYLPEMLRIVNEYVGDKKKKGHILLNFKTKDKK